MNNTLREKIHLSMSELEMEINQYQYILEYSEPQKIVPEIMSMRQRMEVLDRLHTKYCPDCKGGCPSKVYLIDATNLLDELKAEGFNA